MSTLGQQIKKLTIAAIVCFVGFSCAPISNSVDLPGIKGPYLQLKGDIASISFIVEDLPYNNSGRYDLIDLFSEFERSYVEYHPAIENKGVQIIFNISLEDLFSDGIENLPLLNLPGGRPLPGVVSGTLPAAQFTLEKFENIMVFVGPKVAGVYLPVNFKKNIPSTILSFKFSINRKKIGTIHLVGPDAQGKNSGVLLLLNIDGWLNSYLY